MNAWLENSSGAKIPLRGTLSIGRSQENTLILKGDQASRRHALVHPQGGGEHWLVDLGSSNGTLHQGCRICHPVRLSNQDAFQIGDYRLTYHRVETAPGSPPEKALPGDTCSVRTWLLLADIQNSSELLRSESTERAAFLMGRWFHSCKETIEQNRGMISRYLDDGLFAYWPDPGTPCASVARVVSDLETLQGDRAPAFRAVVHYGKITINRGVSDGEEDLTGAEVDFVGRMEKLAGSLGKEWLISEPAGSRLLDFLALSPAGRHGVPDTPGQHRFYTF